MQRFIPEKLLQQALEPGGIFNFGEMTDAFPLHEGGVRRDAQQ